MGTPGDAREQKAESILLACNARQLGLLRQLASSPHGLVRDEVRQVACGSSISLLVPFAVLIPA